MSSREKRGVPRIDFSENRFRRLVSACGLSAVEAAEFLEIQPQSAHQKSMGRRGITAEEEKALVALWGRVRDNRKRLDESFPAGARRQQFAIWEAECLFHGIEPSAGAFRHYDYYRDNWREEDGSKDG